MRLFLLATLALVVAQDTGTEVPSQSPSVSDTSLTTPETPVATPTASDTTVGTGSTTVSAPTDVVTPAPNVTVTDTTGLPTPTDSIFVLTPPELPQLETYSYPQPPIPATTLSSPPSAFTAGLGGLTPPAPRERFYKFEMTYAAGKPDGFLRRMSVINNQFPGPLIEGYVGDTLVVNVTNHLDVGQSIHWHGIVQNHTNHMDGVPGISQCPIPPGKWFVYRFKLESSGTFWYHSHFGNTMADGLVGGLIVHERDGGSYKKGEGDGFDYSDERVLFLGDQYHDQSEVIVDNLLDWGKGYQGSHIPGMPDSIMINGLGQTDCSKVLIGRECDKNMPYAEIKSPLGSKIRFRLINPSAHAQIRLSIDQHVLKVIEVDDMPIKPLFVHELQIDPGQRYSVIVHLNQAGLESAFWIRARLAANCVFKGYQMDGLGILRYTDIRNMTWVDTPPSSSMWPDIKDPLDSKCDDMQNDYTLEPLEPLPPPDRVYTVERIDSVFGTFLNGHGQPFQGFGWNTHQSNDSHWSTFINYINVPLLDIVEKGGQINTSRIATVNLDQLGAADIVINQLDDGISHPFHFHGRPFFIMARGKGVLRAEDVPKQEFYQNPIRRDTLTIPGRSWAVIRLITDTPGIWPVHCHIGLHLALGKMGVLVIRPNDIAPTEEKKPPEWAALCVGDPNEIGPARRRAIPPQARAPKPVPTIAPMHARQNGGVDPNDDPNTPYFSMDRTSWVQRQNGVTLTSSVSEPDVVLPSSSINEPLASAQSSIYATLTAAGAAQSVFSSAGIIPVSVTVVAKGGSPLQSAIGQGVDGISSLNNIAQSIDGGPAPTPTITTNGTVTATDTTATPAPGSGSGSIPVATTTPTST